MSLKKAFLTISSFTMLSRIFGFVRDILMAAFLGVSLLTEVFLVAFKLPNFFRRLFAEGAFSSSFVPIYSGSLGDNNTLIQHHNQGENLDDAKEFADNAFTLLGLFLSIFCLLGLLFMPYIIHIIAPGFGDDALKLSLSIELACITFFYLFFISLVSLLSGILNSHNHFSAPAFAPVLLNISMISALLIGHYTDIPKTTAHALAYGVLIAGLLQFCLCYMVALRLNVNPILKPSSFKILQNEKIRLLLKRMLPGIIGAGVTQINLLVDMIIATFFAGSLSYLYYADRISQLPLAIIGTAMGVAILPSLAKHIKQKQEQQAIELKNKAIQLALFLSLPACIALITIALPIISTLFERGQFSHQDAIATSYALIAYAIGLPAFVMIKILVQGFFARGDTKTPVKIAIICLLANILFSLSLLWLFLHFDLMPHIALAFATSLSAYLNCSLLYLKDKFELQKSLKKNIGKISLASIFLGAFLWATSNYFAIFDGAKLSELKHITILGVMITSSLVIYLLWGKKARLF